MLTRRRFLGALGAPAAASAAVAMLDPVRAARALAAVAARVPPGADPATVAADEDYWAEIGRAFTVDRSIVNLNNGGVSPSPGLVQEAMRRHLDHANSHPPPLVLLGGQKPQVEAVRQRLARAFGCDPEELALTRNASEGLQICQFGLDLQPGDEVLTSDQDYPRMLNTFRQRERREGIVLREIPLPVPAEDPAEIVRRFEQALTERTRLILVCHMINLTGQILPVKEIVAMARQRGVPVIVDGAHALAHFEFKLSDLECDYYATSLHKWLFAPHGTGLLYVRKERIPGVWPLMAASEEQTDDIRKFEEIGTHPVANQFAIGEALDFHLGLGPARKQARLEYLRDHWARRLLAHDRVRLNTSLLPGMACGIANVAVDGIEAGELQQWLWKTHRILVTPIGHADCKGLRVSPSVYTSLEELDRFCDAVEHVLANGLPA
ncbi:MAG: aminotransferase class V-fold PLP-dependent enzyme [Planctomycetota bacterium]|jgi:selenocysteine lyase/cysteine desulfurase